MTSPFRGSESEHTRQQLRAKRFRRLSRDLYVLRDRDLDLRTRVRAAQLVFPETPACLFTAGARLHLPVDDDGLIHLARTRLAARSERADVKVHRFTVLDDEVHDLDGIPVTHGPRTLADLAPRLGLEDLVAVGDVVARRWSVEEVAEQVQRSRRRPGLARLTRAASLLDPRADSPAETRGRLRLHAAGFAALRHKVVVRDEHGGWLAEPDLADPVARVAWQHEGEVHFLQGEQRRKKDIDRDEVVRAEGWQVVSSTSIDDREPARLVQKMTSAYLRAAVLWGRDVLPGHLR
jgi:hypothetical protein